jgi:hypothetical protein
MCTTFYEGADLATMRNDLVQKLGNPDRETISDSGFRIYWWAHNSIMLTMDAHCVHLTVQRDALAGLTTEN